MLEVIDLSFDYHNNPVLDRVSFVLPEGCLLYLHGNNGSGKTTLLKLVAGLLGPLSGVIQVNGQNITQQLSIYQQGLCYVGHKTGISLALTVEENIRFDLQLNALDSIEAHLKQFGLFDNRKTPCYLLSAGQRRRVGLLRLCLADKKLWLLDEPLVALDQDAIRQLKGCMREHLKRGGQIILTSHQSFAIPDVNLLEYSL